MNDAASKSGTQDIVVDEVFPHAPETIWKTLTAGELIGRWLMMAPTGFEPVKGKHLTFQTRPDGVIHCEVLEVARNERPSYSWQGGMTAMRNMARASTRSSPALSRGSTAAQGCVSCTPAS